MAYEFKVDPVTMLKSDYFDWALRLAAMKYIGEQREKANREAKQKRK